jgi:hypothetical protein
VVAGVGAEGSSVRARGGVVGTGRGILGFRREGRNVRQCVTRDGAAGPYGGALARGGQKGEHGGSLLGGGHGGCGGAAGAVVAGTRGKRAVFK